MTAQIFGPPSSVATETERAIAREDQLQGEIEAEISARVVADDVLQDNIVAAEVEFETHRSFRFEQSTPSASWTIVHNLGFFPAGIYVEDSAGTRHNPWIEFTTINIITLIFIGATDGFAILS